MKGLAQFVMRGRWQALLLTVGGVVSVAFSWLSAAIVTLVMLRKGAREGAWLLLWTMLPAVVLAGYMGDSTGAVLVAGTAMMGLVLRETVSLSLAVLASVVVGLVAGGLMLAIGQEFLAAVNEEFVEPYLQLREAGLAELGNPVTLPRPTPAVTAAAVGAGTAMMSVMCLLLARYWQAALYNPGGFGEEFRRLRYSASVSLALTFAVLVLSGFGMAGSVWAILGVIPLTFAGVGLIHARARYRGWPGALMALFYASWLVLPMQLMMVGLAIADSWFNFRERWDDGSGGNGKQLDSRDRQDDNDI